MNEPTDLALDRKTLLTALISFKKGDFSVRLPLDLTGVDGKIADTFNEVIELNQRMALEHERISRVVGKEGLLSQRASIGAVTGAWEVSMLSVNTLIEDLVYPTSETARVIGAVAKGDLSQSMTLEIEGQPIRGEFLRAAKTVNTMVSQLGSFASEVTRVAREVGTEGKLGGQALVAGVAGTWKDLTDNVNFMASNLTGQVRNIVEVATAIASGDLTKKITVDVKGEVLDLKVTINTMVDKLNSFASEVTRVAREVGTEGKLGGQADVKGVGGIWNDLTENVNFMASNLTGQVRNIVETSTAIANGDLTKKITVDVKGEFLELKVTMNTMVDKLNAFASEVTRVAREVGTEGKLGGQADVKGVGGIWNDLTENVNFMASNLTGQVRNITEISTAIAAGDLSKKITVDVKGEVLGLKNTINTMVDKLNAFASEVTRVAREVGTEGKLGGQADVKGVGGIWNDLTENVNFMASNLTGQVRNIVEISTAIANGDLTKKITVDVKGEFLELKGTINSMVDQLNSFASEVTMVAREVGVEGKLGGQATVPGASGTWKDLTDNVNQLAANLTTQVRALAEVATAVTKGDLTRSISVAAQGEVAALKDNINEMIRNLKDTTLKNSEQDWIKTNLAKFARMLQGQKDLITVGKLILSELAPVVSAQQAVFYTLETSRDDDALSAVRHDPRLKLLASYAYTHEGATEIRLGEGLIGQCAIDKEKLILVNVPHDHVKIATGLGRSAPNNIMILPVLFEGQVKAVIELASLERFSPSHEVFLDQLTESIGIVLNTIEASMRTEDLLKQAQSQAKELLSQQEELKQTNQELEVKAGLLANQNVEVERKNSEVEQARSALEEKARQLALTSKYKSEFLANMSHELRTPLNSLLILSDQLLRNQDGNLSGKQVDYAKTIHASGNDLLSMINDILDLSKIESGTVTVEAGELRLADLKEDLERGFRHVAESRGLIFSIKLDANLPKTINTDSKRLQQVLKNLLSNAFKFTEDGSVTVKISTAMGGWNPEQASLNRARGGAVSFSVIDTGIGIAPDKQRIIFEAFQQADGSTNRKYGGTGLGLAISREISRMLGGEISLLSAPGVGSTFTVYLPRSYALPKALPRKLSEVGAPQSTVPPTLQPLETALEEAPDFDIDFQIPEYSDLTNEVSDDRSSIRVGDRVALIVDNDLHFSRYLFDQAHERGFKGLVTSTGAAALALAKEFNPTAILLDIQLPDIDGWRVLDHLKGNLTTRHIPVYVISIDDKLEHGLRLGAHRVFTKPIKQESVDEVFASAVDFAERRIRTLLLVEDDEHQRDSIVELLGADDVAITAVGTGKDALACLKDAAFDCMILDVGLPDLNGSLLLEKVKKLTLAKAMPIIVYTARTLTAKEAVQAKKLAHVVMIKDFASPGRLLDQTSMWLHRVHANLPANKRLLVEKLRLPDVVLAGRTVLVVDDDIRNIYAMTSLLERAKMAVLSADDGKSAIELLMAKGSAKIDVVLMDIMMPGMDGYETMGAIRAEARFRNLPIIAVTAKAMKGDREKCLEAGASDYIAKPVDTDRLLSLLSAWLYHPNTVAAKKART